MKTKKTKENIWLVFNVSKINPRPTPQEVVPCDTEKAAFAVALSIMDNVGGKWEKGNIRNFWSNESSYLYIISNKVRSISSKK